MIRFCVFGPLEIFNPYADQEVRKKTIQSTTMHFQNSFHCFCRTSRYAHTYNCTKKHVGIKA